MANFTLDQQKAHDPLRHLAITANAGSGKTRVLVSRYCDLVELFGAMPDRIAAITFTEKAASELRGKIAGELDSRLASDEHRPNWGRLKRARERFPSAIVTTIHGFCSQMLREYPIEVGVPPNFGIVSGYERRRMLDESLMEAIEAALEPESAAFDVARKVGRERMETILRMMLDKREIVAYSRAHGVLANEPAVTVRGWLAAIEKALRAMLLAPDVERAVTMMAGLMKPDNAAEALQGLADLRAARDIDDIILRASELRTLLLTNDGKPRKRSYPSKDVDFTLVEIWAAVVGGAMRRAARFIDSSGDPALHNELLADTGLLLTLADDAIRRYDARKSRANALDFEDLQLRLLDALASDSFAAEIRERFDHIMIDEFQDTNELQYAIARRMLAGLDVGRLSIVGDTKQSIYGFRNADVEVFHQASLEIADGNTRLGRTTAPLRFRSEEIEPGNNTEAGGVIKLTASFRLLPSICAYVNDACAPILVRREATGFGVDYEPLVCARRSAGRGRVEFILATPSDAQAEDSANEPTLPAPYVDEPDAATEAATLEPEMIARRIAWLVNGGEQVVWDTPADGVAEAARAARWGDVAILCRKRSMFEAIEQALRAHGIPFATHGGSGFYRTQEIYDMLNYLRAILNARDDIALIGVLRSPMFAVSDAEIYRLTLAAGNEGHDLWSRAMHRVRSGTAAESLARATEAIEEDRAMAGRIPASLLLKRAIERTGWRGTVIGAERGEQNLANVEKLLELAREYEARGFTNLFDLVERIGEMVEVGEMEGEAPLNTGRDAVHLMTMHAAKGLEFPVVVLPSLHAPTRTSTEPFFDKDLGFGWTWRFNHREYRPAITALMGMRATERERAEEARLFYVATTRARDLLIASGEYDSEHPPSGTMLEWALSPLAAIPDGNTDVPLAGASLGFLDPDGVTLRTENWEQQAGVWRAIPPPPADLAEKLTPLPFRSAALRIGELPARARGEIYSATQFLVYHQCPSKYYLKYRLGMPEEIAEGYMAADDAEPDTDDGLPFARLFRIVAERLDRAVDPATRRLLRDDDGVAIGLERLVTDALRMEPLSPADAARHRARLTATFTNLDESDAARAILFPPGAEAMTAMGYTLPFDADFITGQIDRVLRTNSGELAAVQFKTRRVGRDRLAATAAEYLPQLRMYAYLLAARNRAQQAITCSVVFTEHPDAPQAYTFSRFDIRRIEDEIRTAIEHIRAITYSGRHDLPTTTPHCPSCAYWVEGRCFLG